MDYFSIIIWDTFRLLYTMVIDKIKEICELKGISITELGKRIGKKNLVFTEY